MTDQPEQPTEVIEAYCVRDKMTVEMLNPQPVWTSRGTPGTRGECPECGGAVFRMGATYLHEGLERPTAVQVAKKTRRKPPKLPPNTVYIAYSTDDEALAETLAEDLQKIGMASWLHEADSSEVAWAGGVHPALKDCERMVFVLSAASIADEGVASAWRFFKKKRKPMVIAQAGAGIDPPDDIRRSPRFDFAGDADYKSAFRQMVQALSR